MDELDNKLDAIGKLLKQCEQSKLISFAYQDAIFSISFSKAEAEADHSTSIIQKLIMEKTTDLKNDSIVNVLDDLAITDISLANKQENENIITITSPFVGTVEFHDQIKLQGSETTVTKGEVICTIEAMKLYNEINAPYSGTIVEILVENCSFVEYAQPLLTIRVDKDEQ